MELKVRLKRQNNMKHFATLILLFLTCANNHLIADNKVQLIDHEMTDQTENYFLRLANDFKFDDIYLDSFGMPDKEDRLIYGEIIASGVKKYHADYLLTIRRLKGLKKPEFWVSQNDISFFKKLKGTTLSKDDLEKLNLKKPFTDEELVFLEAAADEFKKCLRNEAFPSTLNELNSKILKYHIVGEKHKVTYHIEIPDIDLQSIAIYLKKYKITWGDLQALDEHQKPYKEVLKKYYDRVSESDN